MKPVSPRDLVYAEPLRLDDDVVRRLTPTKLAKLYRSVALCRAAAFVVGPSQRETARKLHEAFTRYREGAWRRERFEATCPARRVGRIEECLWDALKARDASVSEITVRRALSCFFEPAKRTG